MYAVWLSTCRSAVAQLVAHNQLGHKWDPLESFLPYRCTHGTVFEYSEYRDQYSNTSSATAYYTGAVPAVPTLHSLEAVRVHIPTTSQR